MFGQSRGSIKANTIKANTIVYAHRNKAYKDKHVIRIDTKDKNGDYNCLHKTLFVLKFMLPVLELYRS